MPRTKSVATTSPEATYDPLDGNLPKTPIIQSASPMKEVTDTETQKEEKVKTKRGRKDSTTITPANPENDVELNAFLNYTGCVVKTISPKMAQHMIDTCNTCNRPMDRKRVKRLAAAMSRGEWQVNGQTIVFSESKRLLDGQNRLAAIVEANKDIDTYVVSGISDEAFVSIDTGKSRTGSHVLAINHIKHSFAVAATLNKVSRYTNKVYEFDGANILTNRQLMHVYDSNKSVTKSVERYTKYARGFSKSTIAFCHFVLAKIDHKLADSVFDSLMEETPSNPIIANLQKQIVRKSGKQHRMRQTTIIATIFKAWNALRQDQPDADIIFHATETFPIPA